MLPLVWLATAPAARRYVAGWAGQQELHVLAPTALRARASNVPGSREMLALSAAALYARRVVIENNRELSRAHRPARAALELRWAWLRRGRRPMVLGTDRALPAGDRAPAARGSAGRSSRRGSETPRCSAAP